MRSASLAHVQHSNLTLPNLGGFVTHLWLPGETRGFQASHKTRALCSLCSMVVPGAGRFCRGRNRATQQRFAHLCSLYTHIYMYLHLYLHSISMSISISISESVSSRISVSLVRLRVCQAEQLALCQRFGCQLQGT